MGAGSAARAVCVQWAGSSVEVAVHADGQLTQVDPGASCTAPRSSSGVQPLKHALQLLRPKRLPYILKWRT